MSLVAPSSILSSSSPLTLQLRIALPQRTHPSNLPLAPRLNRNLTSDLSSIPAYSRNTTSVSVYCLGPYGGGSILQDAGAASLVMGGAYALVSTFDKLSQRNIIKQNLSRKLVHIISGLLFMVSWPVFSTSSGARYFASLVPLVNCLRLLIHGLSLANDEGLIKSVTRDGKPEELLRGPLYYVLVLIFCAVIFWRESPVGVVSLAMMCGGDGIADIMGRRFGKLKIPYNQQKSWAGSISMFVFGFFVSMGMLYYYSILGYFHMENWVWTMERVALVSLVATVVESLPVTQIKGNPSGESGVLFPSNGFSVVFLSVCKRAKAVY